MAMSIKELEEEVIILKDMVIPNYDKPPIVLSFNSSIIENENSSTVKGVFEIQAYYNPNSRNPAINNYRTNVSFKQGNHVVSKHVLFHEIGKHTYTFEHTWSKGIANNTSIVLSGSINSEHLITS